MPQSRHVIAVICRFDWEFYRTLLLGACDFGRETGHRVFPSDITKAPQFWGDETTAILYDGTNERVRRWVRARKLPAVDVSGYANTTGILVRPDDAVVAELVANHLLGKGLRDLGFVGLTGSGFSECRRAIFRARVEAAGARYHEFVGERPDEARPFNDPRDPPALKWLKKLPKPVGLFACHDDRALRLLQQCRRAGVRVPEEVAVVGVDNDMLHVAAANPPLSSVDIGVRHLGFEAARILVEHADNPVQKLENRIVSIKPIGLVARQSSDIMAISDTAIATAIRYIREHVHEGLRVKHLTAVTDLSRRSLEQRFRLAIGRSPSEEIRRVQMDLSRNLLATTKISMQAIADQTGFSSARQFGATFLAQAGVTPTAYRKQFASGTDDA